jgi:hypothetical protein
MLAALAPYDQPDAGRSVAERHRRRTGQDLGGIGRDLNR